MATRIVKRRFTVENYHKMAHASILSEDDRVELIEGEILEIAPIGSRHAAAVDRITSLFTRRLGQRAIVRVQNPISLGEDSEPQPDVTILRPRPDFYAPAHPGPEDVLLVVEVAETSSEYDRTVKVPLYARAGVPEVWLVVLADGDVEVYRNPTPTGYTEVATMTRGQPLQSSRAPELQTQVDEVLG